MADVFEPAHLPDHEKLQLCEELLREFGVTRWRKTNEGEMIHSCPLPHGGHKNGDRNPSASLNFKKLVFRCMGCGGRGGLLWFIAVCRGEDAEGVREWLSDATGTGGHVMDTERLLAILDAFSAPSAPPPPITAYSQTVLKPWLDWPIHHPYLTDPVPEGRGCHPDTLTHFKIGYAEEYFMGEHQPTQERIVIPLFWRNELVGWQARRLAPWDEPKYKNTPELPRDRVIYNYHSAREALVVESPLSVLRHWHHIPTICSTMGAAVSETQQRLLHRFDRVVLWFDNDTAGWGATYEVGNALMDYVDVWAVESPWDVDPADLDDTTTEELLEQAVPFVVWEPPKKLKEWSNGNA